MHQQKPESGRHFTEAARVAAAAARAAKLAAPDRFGEPDLFVVRASAGDMTFTWEIRRYGGVVMQAGVESYPTMILAKAAGLHVLEALRQDPDLPTFKRLSKSRAIALEAPL